MQLSTLSSWLAWIGSVHNTEIDLGIDRIREVALRLHLLPPACPVIMVGGTNGKGSVVAGLESIYCAAGYQVGAFTSPYLFQHNEEVRVNRQMASDEAFCKAFEKIESVRGAVSLSPFEFHTLAALLIFKTADLDVMILEIGLGGRLDAVNIVDADVSVVTSIGIDHTEWLGDTREAIAIEKAGIFRSNKPAICGDANPPSTLIECAQKTQAQFYQQGRDFNFTEQATTWTWQKNNETSLTLPRNNLLTQNMSTVLMAISCMQNKLPVSETAIRQGLQDIRLIGRMQLFDGPIKELFDVAHNPHAAIELAKRLREQSCAGKTIAVFSMLHDKDIVGTIREMREVIDEWYVAPLTCQRAASLSRLVNAFEVAGESVVQTTSTLQEAYIAAKAIAAPGDRIIVFGSFYVVGELLPQKSTAP